MKREWHKVELAVDHLIPYCLVILAIIIIMELFFEAVAHHYEPLFRGLDFIVVAIFAADLVFKYIRMKNIPKFLKTYWLDILAIFPFYLFFRAFEIVIASRTASESFHSAQMLLHEGLEIEKEGQKIVREAGNASRAGKLQKLIRPILRLPRFLKLVSFFEKPTGRHHHHEKHIL